MGLTGSGGGGRGGWLLQLSFPSLTLICAFLGQAELGTNSRVMDQVGAELGLQG